MLRYRLNQLLLDLEGLEPLDLAPRADPGQLSELVPLVRTRKPSDKTLTCALTLPKFLSLDPLQM